MKIEAVSFCEIGGRRENEDSAGCKCNDTELIAVVADGLGGQGDGKAASQLVCDSLLSHTSDNKLPDAEEIARYFEKANRELIAKQENSFHMKTTAVFLRIYKNTAVWAHVGDSRLYHLWNGKMQEYTLDHSAAQLSVYMGKITREQIPNDPGQSRLLRAMGVEGERADIHDPITLEEGQHVFLLCSDGLWEYVSDEEIVRACSIADSPKRFAEYLCHVKESRSEAECDNYSGVIVYVKI